jgi:hypothetical protein
MKWIVSKIAGLGDYLLSLSDRTRTQLVLVALLVLGGGGAYKLFTGINRLYDTQPAASPEELIKPMEQIFRDTKTNVNRYQQQRQNSMSQLDSLANAYANKKTVAQ